MRVIAAALLALLAVSTSAASATGSQRPDSMFYLTETRLPDPELFIRIDKVVSMGKGIERVLAIQGACWFNGRGYKDVPRWAATVQLGPHHPLRPKALLVVSADPARSWRYELRNATAAEIQHYLNCDWPPDAWPGPNHVFLLDEAPTKPATSIDMMRVVSVGAVSRDAQVVRTFMGACPDRGNIVPPTVVILDGHPALKPGDLLIPGSNVAGYQLLEFMRPSLRHATASERRQYASCSWPASMMQP
jgi:hypothetical protein